MPLPGADGLRFLGNLHGLDCLGEPDSRAQGGAFDGADDLTAVGRGAGAVPRWDLLPRSAGKLFQQRGPVPCYREDVVRPTPCEMVGVAGLRMQCVGGGDPSGQERTVVVPRVKFRVEMLPL